MADDPSIPTVFGWDASDYDWERGPMDIAAAKRDGIDFFTHKATEATWTKHAHYGEAMRRARDAGISVLGAYHVVRSPADAEREVDYCLAYVEAQTPWWRDFPCWFWQVDLEKWSYDNVPAAEGEAFADIIEAKTGRKAVIYASRGQYGNALTGTSHELWNANYGANNAGHYAEIYAARGGDSGAGWVTYSGRMPIFWQYGSDTRIGTQSRCDANAFRGTLSELRALIGGKSMPTPEEIAEHRSNMNTWQTLFDTLGDHDMVKHLKDIWTGAALEFPNEPVLRAKRVEAGVKELLARPPVQAAPIDQATFTAALKAALKDPEVGAALAAIMRPVVDGELDEAFAGGSDNDTTGK